MSAGFSGSSFNSLLGKSATASVRWFHPMRARNNLVLEVCSAPGSAGSTGMPIARRACCAA